MIPRPRWCRVCRRMVLWERVKGVRQCQTCGHPVYGLRQPKALRKARKPLGWKRAEAKAAGSRDEAQLEYVLRWYGWKCGYCEQRPAQQWDHRVPIAHGGPDLIGNLIPSCIACNAQKGTQTWEPRRRHPFMEPVGKEQSA